MQMVFILTGAMLAPLLGLALLLWLAHLEDTLHRDVQRARHRPDPAPILAIPVRPGSARTTVAALPRQRTAAVSSSAIDGRAGILAVGEAIN
jgi:hypothetical protein